jgi:hypothetical protein
MDDFRQDKDPALYKFFTNFFKQEIFGKKIFTLCYEVNSNPHCFIAITKAADRGGKDPLLPQPMHTLHSPVWGSKSTLKITFLLKTSESNKFLKIFCEAFLILKKVFLKASLTYFRSKLKKVDLEVQKQ